MKKLPLNLIYLKYFYHAVRGKSLTESAKMNHVSQSAVSQGIAKLEKSLCCCLISHQPNRFKVTNEGRQLYELSKQIFKTIEQTEDALMQDGGRITFGCTHSFALTHLPEVLKLAKKLLPQLRINFRLGHFANINQWIKEGTIDFGILLDNVDLSSFERIRLYHGMYRLFISKDQEHDVDLPFLLDTEERTETNLLKKAYHRMYGKQMPILMEVSSWGVIAKLVEEGLGIGLFPDYIAHRNNKLKAVLEELNPMEYTLYALFEKNLMPSAHALKFLELLKQFLESE